MIHIQGLGILGSLLAWRLYERNTYFTWSDTDERVCAWRASTGAVYPSGDAIERQCWSRWQRAHDGENPWQAHIGTHTERCAYWFSSKAPPHSAPDRIVRSLGALRMGSASSIHFNAQSFVPATRSFFADRRRQNRAAGDRLIVSHGFSKRRARFLWGWTTLVRLSFDRSVSAASAGARPTVYCREGRFVMAYAYPVPGTPWWYAGSSLTAQQTARELDPEKHRNRWRKNFLRLTGGVVSITDEGETIQGWRPVIADGDSIYQVTTDDDGTVTLPPLWNSGIRLSPFVLDAACEALL